MRRRVGRPNLLGTAARTAVVAGTATAVSGKVQRAQQDKAAQAQAGAADQAADGSPQAADAAEHPAATDLLDRLERLGQLKKDGLLSDAEFTAAKAQLLGL